MNGKFLKIRQPGVLKESEVWKRFSGVQYVTFYLSNNLLLMALIAEFLLLTLYNFSARISSPGLV